MPDMTLEQAMAEGGRLERAGDFGQAEVVYRAILSQLPNYPGAVGRLAFLAHRSGRGAQAVELLQRAVGLQPNSVDFLANLGTALAGQRRFTEAAEAFARALTLAPQRAALHNNLGSMFHESGQWDRAIEAYQTALALEPDQANVHYNLGNSLSELRKFKEATAHERRAVELKPDYAEAWQSLGNALRDDGKPDEALAAYTRALEIRPNLGGAWQGLGSVYQATGRPAEAVASYRRAAELLETPAAGDAILVTMHLDPANDAKALFEEHIKWNHKYAAGLARQVRPHENDPNPDKRLRVGYVSGYLNSRPAGRFMLPLLTNHNHQQFEVVCYSDSRTTDAMTGRLRAGADTWRETVRLSDAELADFVRKDQIDVLIDLGMHTRRNRMMTFARKPAPVQATYLAYCSTTGLETIDYRISDPYLDPTESDEAFYSERTVRIPSYWCYPPPDQAPEVGALPAAGNGYVTFGCLNDFSKVTSESLSMWAEVMRAAPNSRLILHALEGSRRNRVADALGAAGIDGNRIEFVAMLPGQQYFARYGQIDIALDPTPWCGGTTTCDALWMGVPVVTLSGRTAISRGGVSILSQIGLQEFIAHHPMEYVKIACDLAGDSARLAEIRASLRDRMRKSPLMDGPAFAREFEAALRKMWLNWCATRP